jgi:diguanylate cyclase (GGDEF)-like protein/PAS domain S-box-containing protein
VRFAHEQSTFSEKLSEPMKEITCFFEGARICRTSSKKNGKLFFTSPYLRWRKRYLMSDAMDLSNFEDITGFIDLAKTFAVSGFQRVITDSNSRPTSNELLPPQGPTRIRHTLQVWEKNNEREILLDACTYSIGRHKANTIVLCDNTISRQHALLLRIPDSPSGDFSFRMIDGNFRGRPSQNGIWINGKRCYAHTLAPGDMIAFSPTVRAMYHQVLETDPSLTSLPLASTQINTIESEPKEFASPEQLNEAALIRLSSFPELMPHPLIEMDLSGQMTYLNPAAIAQFPDLCTLEDHPLRQRINPKLLQPPKLYQVREVEVNGLLYEQFIHYIPQSNLIRCYLVDITQRKHTESILRKSEERYAVAARAANDGLWDWDLTSNTIYLSSRWKAMIGYDELELSDQLNEWFDRLHPEDVDRVKIDLNRHMKGCTSHFEAEFRLRHRSGDYRWFRSRGMTVFDPDGVAYRMVGSQTDITEHYLAREQLMRDAFYDAMTGLPNRLLLMDRMSQALKKCKRQQQKHCGVLFLDLDRFKVINDSLGHMLGDVLLIEVAKRLSHCLREEDTVARLGGDEFVVLLEGIEDVGAAITTAQRIQQALKPSVDLDGHEVFPGASIGIALGHSHYESPEDLLRDADAAMYQAKKLGKNRYQVFQNTMPSHTIDHLTLENDLHRALERQEFILHYQPIIDLKTQTICGFEALTRWRHPQRGLVPPSDFIPLAEETGLIVPMGKWLMREACGQIRAWQQQFNLPSSFSICVNISSRQFSHPDFVENLEMILSELPLPHGSLKLEITEGVIMQQPNLVIDKLCALKELGVKLSIDDFGTGYSSLSYLQIFPVDTLKVDRSFVMKMGDHDSREIVKTIVTLAHNLQLDVVAEGVETQAQADLLREMNCEYAQGFFYSRPVDAQDATQLLHGNHFSKDGVVLQSDRPTQLVL